MGEQNNVFGDDVTGQFVLNDIENVKSVKNEENAIYITRTLIQSNPKKKKEFEQRQRSKNGISNQDKSENTKEKNVKKMKVNKTNKKLAKYGFVDKKNENEKNQKMSKREKNKRKKRAKYKKYDKEDRILVEQLLGIKSKKKEENEKKEKMQEPKDGYELNKNPKNLKKNKESKEENEQNEEDEDDDYDKERKLALSVNLENSLNLLVGKVYENDTILYSMAMCLPYSAASNENNFDYKIKIEPGTNKRGRATKYVSELFEKMVCASPHNQKLDLLAFVKSIKETEINHIFLSNVKISGKGIKSLQLHHKHQQKRVQKEKWNLQQKQLQKQQKAKKQYCPSTNPKKRKKRK